jgi:hypothetical protein
VARLLNIPVVGGNLSFVGDFFKGGNHLGFEVAEIVLDSAGHGEGGVEGNVFHFLGVHTTGGAVGLVALLNELEALESIEAIANVLVDLDGVVTVGQNVEQGLVGNEVEARENLLLLFKVLVKGLLASLNLLVETD